MYSPLFFFGFWLGIPIVLLILFALFKPKLTPLTALICPAADLMVYWQEFLYYESRGILLQAKPALFCFLAAASLLFSAAASIPNLLYHLVAGRALALHSAYDFLLLAAALYTLARLLQMLPYERPAIHGLVQSILRRRADSAEVPEEEAIAPEEEPADILPPPEAEEPDEETEDDQ